MTTLFDWLSGSPAESLCLALMHSLWQGAAWSLLLLVVLRRIADDRPRVRYVVAITCFYGLLGGVCLTWSILRHSDAVTDNATPTVTTAGETEMSETAPIETIDHLDSPTAKTDVASGTLALGTLTSETSTSSLATFVPWVMAGWMIGASICLLLSTIHVASTGRLRSGTPIDDADILRLLDRMIASFRLSRPIELLSVDGPAVPCVVGVLKPAILIPASLVTGLTPDQWEAILAHELAHIRRWDYLVNLSQLVIESLLFFNPAVWWISRQVRVEREACCDATAVGLTARPIQYATLLVDLVERLQSGSGGLGSSEAVPTVSFGRERSGSLMERVRRIVTPGRRNELTLRQPAAALFLVLGLIAVGCLQAGTDMAVDVAADILTDEQRVEVLVESAKEVGGPDAMLRFEELDAVEEKLTIRGTIAFDGEEPSQKIVYITESTDFGFSSLNRGFAPMNLDETSEFNVEVGPGITWLQFNHSDFAATIVGPYGADDGPLVKDVHVVLKPGIDIPVILEDEHGNPVSEACIRPVMPHGGVTFQGTKVTDKNGRMILEHINPDLEYRLWVTAPGCQKLHAPIQKFKADSTVRLNMFRAQQVTGIIVNQQGKAVVGANVKGIWKRAPGTLSQLTELNNEAVATSDTEGRFQLTELEDRWEYYLLVKTPDYAPTTVLNVRPGDKDIRVELAPPITIQGTIIGSKEQLASLQTRHGIRWTLEFSRLPGDQPRLLTRGSQPCEVVEGVGKFTLPPMAPGTLTLSVGDSSMKRELTESMDDLRIDLSDPRQLASAQLPPTRPVRITFTHDGKTVSPRGRLQIWGPKYNNRLDNGLFPIKDGVVKADLYVPDQLYFKSREMIGFWFDQSAPTEIDAGEEPLEIAIPVLSAGAVKGVIRNADGTPAIDASASVGYRLEYRASTDMQKSHSGGDNVKTNQRGEFFISPIPFGAECSIRVTRDKYVAIGEAFTIRAENALPSFTFKLGTAVDAKVRLLDPSGTPLVGQPVKLSCNHPLAKHGWSPPKMTDRRGECRFERLNPDLEGHYLATLEFTKDYIPALTRFPLKLNGETTVIRAQRGNVIFGTVLDSQGEPVPGVEIVAEPADRLANKDLLYSFQPEAPTDRQGRFRFSNLPPVKMKLRERGLTRFNVEATPTTEEQAKPVTVRMPR